MQTYNVRLIYKNR